MIFLGLDFCVNNCVLSSTYIFTSTAKAHHHQQPTLNSESELGFWFPRRVDFHFIFCFPF
ncbi:hypothetical protein BJX66DRAFT_307722 [Aspergillus keveii]|uniref:Uncharacterized protein n=1 Tax=Aspergillus keveii TaxID=714993 RepID=A0ABR4G089_9EURO